MADKTVDQEIVEEGVHNYGSEEAYIWPEDPKVLDKIEWFRDQKFALMMHWGLYSQLGCVESWALSDEDAEWSRDGIDWGVDGETFKKQYFGLNKTFNPVRFQPDRWAEIAGKAGMKYLIFTTKHHDGFCMWDTAYTDYKITDSRCPFHEHPGSDVCRSVFDAFRNEGLGIAAYFSKADWHVDSYWSHRIGADKPTGRGPSYNPLEHPDEWRRFVDFTHNQIRELGTAYGPIDIMWFDAGWVCPEARQDIRLGEIIEEIRETQPGMLCADRTVGGPYENYVTPEQTVPERPLNIPWESCISLGKGFAYTYDDDFKSAHDMIHLLVKIVAKGGNLALNVAPQPDGRLPRKAIEVLLEMGEWLSLNGEGIYGTRPKAPYMKDNFAFNEKDGKVYAIELLDGSLGANECTIPYEGDVSSIRLLGENRPQVFEKKEEGYRVTMHGSPKEGWAHGRTFLLA